MNSLNADNNQETIHGTATTDRLLVPIPTFLQRTQLNRHTSIACYTDASITPDGPDTQPRVAGFGIVFANLQDSPGNKLYIKAIINNASSVIMAEAGALALAARVAVNMGYTNV
jgi:hypothetical protein